MTSSQPNYGYRPFPQVSANQMAEYLSATGPRRKAIVQEARFPKRSAVARYVVARDSLVRFLSDDTRNQRHLAEAINRLEQRAARPGASDWIKQDCDASREALAAFQRSYNRLGLGSCQCGPVHGSQPPLTFGPTKVSVSLDVLMRKKDIGGPDLIGGAVFVFNRGEASAKKRVERCKVVAGLIFDYCLAHHAENGAPDPSICYGIDVFGQKAYRPPGTFARKRSQIEASAEEIALWWWDVEPPGDYDGPEPSRRRA